MAQTVKVKLTDLGKETLHKYLSELNVKISKYEMNNKYIFSLKDFITIFGYRNNEMIKKISIINRRNKL